MSEFFAQYCFCRAQQFHAGESKTQISSFHRVVAPILQIPQIFNTSSSMLKNEQYVLMTNNARATVLISLPLTGVSLSLLLWITKRHQLVMATIPLEEKVFRSFPENTLCGIK